MAVKKKSGTKFQVGDVVRLKVSPRVKFHILEVHTQVCYANCVQEWYTGREHYTRGVSTKPVQFSMIELEEIPKPPARIKEIEKKLATLNAQKNKLITKQDFEKAAEARVMIDDLKDELMKINLKLEG